jgi:mycoredoxin
MPDSPVAPAPAPMTIYSTTWCGYCVRLKRQLERAGVGYVEVDIEQDESAAELVEQINGGYRTVPTVVLPNGTAMSNPTLAELTEALGRCA